MLFKGYGAKVGLGNMRVKAENRMVTECMFTGMMVKGIITEIEDCKYSVNVKVVFDSPQQWGDDMYEHDWTWGRKSDEFGPLKYLKLIE